MTTSLNNLRPFASKNEEINRLRKRIAELETQNEELTVEASKLRSANHTLEDIREIHTGEIAKLETQCAKWSELDNKAAGRIAELEAQLAEAQDDAEKYQWLRINYILKDN